MEKCGGSNVSTRRDFGEIVVEAESDEVIIRFEQYYSNKRRGGLAELLLSGPNYRNRPGPKA